jgi:hypothetical protein
LLPQQNSATLPGTCEITKDWQGELLQWGAGLDNPFQAWNDACLRGLLLSGLVQTAEIVASLEDMVGHFLTRDSIKIYPTQI